MRAAERTLQNQRCVWLQETADTVYLRNFNAFLQRKRRQNCRNTPSCHRFSRSSRPDIENVVTPRCCRLGCLPHQRKSDDLIKIDVKFFLSRLKQIWCEPLSVNLFRMLQASRQRFHIPDSDDLDPIHSPSLLYILFG